MFSALILMGDRGRISTSIRNVSRWRVECFNSLGTFCRAQFEAFMKRTRWIEASMLWSQRKVLHERRANMTSYRVRFEFDRSETRRCEVIPGQDEILHASNLSSYSRYLTLEHFSSCCACRMFRPVRVLLPTWRQWYPREGSLCNKNPLKPGQSETFYMRNLWSYSRYLKKRLVDQTLRM